MKKVLMLAIIGLSTYNMYGWTQCSKITIGGNDDAANIAYALQKDYDDKKLGGWQISKSCYQAVEGRRGVIKTRDKVAEEDNKDNKSVCLCK